MVGTETKRIEVLPCHPVITRSAAQGKIPCHSVIVPRLGTIDAQDLHRCLDAVDAARVKQTTTDPTTRAPSRKNPRTMRKMMKQKISPRRLCDELDLGSKYQNWLQETANEAGVQAEDIQETLDQINSEIAQIKVSDNRERWRFYYKEVEGLKKLDPIADANKTEFCSHCGAIQIWRYDVKDLEKGPWHKMIRVCEICGHELSPKSDDSC